MGLRCGEPLALRHDVVRRRVRARFGRPVVAPRCVGQGRHARGRDRFARGRMSRSRTKGTTLDYLHEGAPESSLHRAAAHVDTGLAPSASRHRPSAARDFTSNRGAVAAKPPCVSRLDDAHARHARRARGGARGRRSAPPGQVSLQPPSRHADQPTDART